MAFGVYTMFPFTMLSNVEGRSFFLMFRAYAFLLPSINEVSVVLAYPQPHRARQVEVSVVLAYPQPHRARQVDVAHSMFDVGLGYVTLQCPRYGRRRGASGPRARQGHRSNRCEVAAAERVADVRQDVVPDRVQEAACRHGGLFVFCGGGTGDIICGRRHSLGLILFLLPSINDSSFSSSAADILLTDEIVSSGVP